MSESDPSMMRRRNIWAPWRMEYIDALEGIQQDGCFLCRYRDEPDHDEANLVLWRGRHGMALLNRFPYTGGHAMVAPYEHVPTLDKMSPAAMCEMMEMIRDMEILLSEAINAEGFNVGLNIGRCAGAGLPGHLHMHIVPRWTGDTNFMTVLGEARVIPQALEDLFALLKGKSDSLGLPHLSQ